jgi:phosphatidylinositol 3-kinase
MDKLPSYHIKMLNMDIGVIEFVENSITLREINTRGFTLQNYILENNKAETLDVIKKRFAISMATSCCITYLLGLGDRHLDNIMVNQRGQIFNIDYGYILDNPMTNVLGAPNIKVTSDMIDFLGGTNSEYYKFFEDYLLYVYDIMRLYKNIIVDHYDLLGNEQMIDWNRYKDKLETRFMTGLVCRDIKIILGNEIQSSNSYSSYFNDICHNLGMGYRKS